MNLTKLSLAAVVIGGLVSSSFAADTLADAFKNAKVSGELRLYNYGKDTGDENPTTPSASTIGKGHASIVSTAVILGYVTDSLYGFRLGTTVQSNYAPFATKDDKNLFGKDMYGSGAVFSEAYLGYALGKTDVKIGRQFISSPLVWGSGSRIVKESFEGATIVNKDLPNTTMMAGYVSKFQGRTTAAVDGVNMGAKTIAGDDSDIPDFTKVVFVTNGGGSAVKQSNNKYSKAGYNFTFDGAYTASVQNKSISNLTLMGQYVDINDVANIGDAGAYYVEANYLLPISNFKWAFDAVVRGSMTNGGLDAYNLEGYYASARTGIKEWNGLGVTFAYSQTSKDDAVIGGLGNGIYTYTGTLICGPINSLEKNSKAWALEATYDFEKVGIKGLSFFGAYAVDNVKDNDTINSAKTAVNLYDIDYTTITAAFYYDIPSVKGLKVGIEYETQEKETVGLSKVDLNEYRFRAQYKF